jgi:hypothetical protein
MLDPLAVIAAHTVISVPLSAEVAEPSCFIPFVATTLGGFINVVAPVSSLFQMSFAANSYLSITFVNFAKKRATLAWLKAVALPNLVASGIRIDRVVFLFRNQSAPAISFSAQDIGMFISYFFARDIDKQAGEPPWETGHSIYQLPV